MSAFKTYETRYPSAQNAIDAVEGWVGGFLPGSGLKAGASACLFGDGRVNYALDRFGSLAERRVLELGPLEGAHTSMLVAAGARVDAVEANKQAYLRCLVTKEILELQNARFHLGDAVSWLEQNNKRYDLIFACGVLYHMREPLRLLEAMASRSDALYLWTHYVDVEALPEHDARRKGWMSTRETRAFHGETVHLFRRSYVKANETAEFCGGAFDEHRWMDRTSIITALRVLGFTEISVDHEDHTNPHGSSFSIFARRPPIQS